MSKKRLLIFASGSKDGGGSGFENLVNAARVGILEAEIVGVVSNHEWGGVRRRADGLGIQFFHSPRPRTAHDYRRIFDMLSADFVALSGWLGYVEGLPADRTFNIHPAWLPSPFGGTGMYGHHVHEAVMEAYKRGEVKHSGVTMHFATPEYDHADGIFFRKHVPILTDDTPETLARRVNMTEHHWQPLITNRVIKGEIFWDGVNPNSMRGADIE